MPHRSFVWLCLLPLAVVTTALSLLPMARLVVTGAEGPEGLAAYLAILTEPRYRRSEEHTSELQSLLGISYAVFCLDRKSVV